MRWSAAQTLSWIIRQDPLGLKDWPSEMGPKIEPIQKKLATSIGDSKISAWGRKEPHRTLEPIPAGDFRISGMPLVIGPHGDLATVPRHKLSTYEGTPWRDVEFDADEIKREWPKPPPLSAADWMLKEAKRLLDTKGQLGKRYEMVPRCIKETNCTKREAEAAHKILPQGLRRERGNGGRNH
jgi:hypothetical protein